MADGSMLEIAVRRDVTVVVLAGGKSRRMGEDKAEIRLGGRRLIDQALDTACALSSDVLIVRRSDQVIALERDGVRLVSDSEPYEGVMAGILAGLLAARHEWTLVLACDMPFVSLPLVQHMLRQREGHDAVVPRLSVGLEPLHALYRKTCIDPLHHALALDQRRVSAFYAGLDVCYVDEPAIDSIDPGHWSFFNINASQDLDAARDHLQSMSIA